MSLLFEPFVQADSSINRRFGGTGLGLFLARSFCKLLGGDLELEQSSLHVGSRCTASIRAETAVGATASLSPLDTRETSEPLKLPLSSPHGKILIVDDAADNRLLMKLVVTNLGFATELAEGGEEAIEKARQEEFQVILMDVQMPESNGIEAMQTIRSEGYEKPIVCVTAHAMKGDRGRFIELGFDDYLCKPIQSNQVRRILQRFSSEPPKASPERVSRPADHHPTL